ncbi:HD-GYP domain-containing protein [Clostridium estertheticum]|uniref:HD-GYP domain-containing protein n=1 Tax=Clostridium estertheticum TaxID=238834 RepID=UPI001CF0FEA7|nr:HD domain-containing phosphohydrolase [Clostridium estertheticum]MCB2356717.1 HD domain-containing protein [Clostridium estertheticum]WAG39747.1 HD domain-containing protein [Clostridium estertheticum]
MLLSLSEVADLANPLVAQHQHRTAFIALELSKTANLGSEITENIFTAALLHDIGAVSVEEKMAIHNFKEIDENIHTIRGELLLEQIPWLRKISKIVRNHHRNWNDWDHGIDNPVVFSSQIILLSDYVERLINRNKYILHQVNDIVTTIKKLSGTVIHKNIVTYFLDLSKREEFWLDLTSSNLYSLLLINGQFKNMQIELEDISLISNLYRDLIDFKSRFTATHTSGVSECAVKLSELFGLAELDVKSMRIAGNFHDIGKLIIPNSILEKPGKLTVDEFAIIRCHTYHTFRTLNSIGGLQRIAEWAAYHHEKLDGSGYPFHLTSEEIGTGSRIMAVADIFTAISEDRPYRKGMDKNEIYAVIKKQSIENLLDKRIVELLFDNYDVINSQVKIKQSKALSFYETRFSSIIHENKRNI